MTRLEREIALEIDDVAPHQLAQTATDRPWEAAAVEAEIIAAEPSN